MHLLMKRNNYFYLLSALIVFFILFFSSCDSVSDPPPIVDNTFNGFETYQVAEIFAKNCAQSGCHSGTEPEHNLSFESWSKLILGSSGRHFGDTTGHEKSSNIFHGADEYGGEAVIPFNAERSLLYRLIIGDVENSSFRMPYNKPKLSDNEINIIRDWINNGAKSFSGEVPYSSSNDEIFVCNQAGDEVSVIDLQNKLVKRTIDVDLNPASIDHPDHITRKDGFLYVGLVATGKILKIDINTHQIVGTVSGLEFPGMIVFSSDGRKLFVSKSPLAPGAITGVYEIDLATMTLVSEISLPIAGVPHALAITPDDKLLIADMKWDRIYIYDTQLNDFDGDPILMSPGQTPFHEPIHAYISPDGKYLYVSCKGSGYVIIYDVQSRQEAARLSMGDHPMQMAITPDGSKIYVAVFHEGKIKVIKKDGTNWSIENEISHHAFHDLWGIDLTSDGKYVVATSSNEMNGYKPRYNPVGKQRISNVAFVETATNEVVRIIDVERYASGINAR